MSETNYFTPFLCVKKEPFVVGRGWEGGGKGGRGEVIIETVVLE